MFPYPYSAPRCDGVRLSAEQESTPEVPLRLRFLLSGKTERGLLSNKFVSCVRIEPLPFPFVRMRAWICAVAV